MGPRLLPRRTQLSSRLIGHVQPAQFSFGLAPARDVTKQRTLPRQVHEPSCRVLQTVTFRRASVSQPEGLPFEVRAQVSAC